MGFSEQGRGHRQLEKYTTAEAGGEDDGRQKRLVQARRVSTYWDGV